MMDDMPVSALARMVQDLEDGACIAQHFTGMHAWGAAEEHECGCKREECGCGATRLVACEWHQRRRP